MSVFDSPDSLGSGDCMKPELLNGLVKLAEKTGFPVFDWINSDTAINEIGCIHTSQGYDLNYSGIIFGNEIKYNKKLNQIEVDASKYFDAKGKQGVTDKALLKEYILNIYKTMMLRGIRGTYVYICDDNLRAYFKQHLIIKNDCPEVQRLF